MDVCKCVNPREHTYMLDLIEFCKFLLMLVICWLSGWSPLLVEVVFLPSWPSKVDIGRQQVASIITVRFCEYGFSLSMDTVIINFKELSKILHDIVLMFWYGGLLEWNLTLLVRCLHCLVPKCRCIWSAA